MAVTTGSLILYDKAIGKFLDGSIDIDTDDIKIALCTSLYTPDAAAHDYENDLTNEVAGGTGYARVTLASVTWSETSAGVFTFDSADPQFTASGGTITARYFVLLDTTPGTTGTNPLIGYGLLDTTPADVVIADTNTLDVYVNTAGWFTVSKV